MAGQLGLDNKTAERFERLAPEFGIMDLNRPFTLSDHASLPKPVVGTMAHWLDEGDQLTALHEG